MVLNLILVREQTVPLFNVLPNLSQWWRCAFPRLCFCLLFCTRLLLDQQFIAQHAQNHSNSSFKFRAIGHKLRTCTLPTMLSISVSVLGYTGHVDIIIFAPDMIIKMFHAVLPIFQFLLVIKRASPNWRDPGSNARPLLLEKGISAWLCMYTGGSACTAQGEFREYYGRNG